MRRWTRELSEIGEADRPEVGGKALGLARLKRAGLPVPSAVVVVASFFEEARSYAPEEPEPEAVAGRIPAAYLAEVEAARLRLGDAPAGYAIRSSAVEEDQGAASFAGVHESILAVPPGRLVPEIFRCWASAFSERALLYRRRMGFAADVSAIRMAVVIQKMLQPSASGILFSRASASSDDLLIQVAPGAGERRVQGKDEPWVARLPRRPGGEGKEPPAGGPLPGSRLIELSALALRAEALWMTPLDIEWALEEDRVFLLQARPVTAALPGGVEASAPGGELTPGDDTLWTRANLRELLPELPSPLFLSLMKRVDWREAVRRLGLDPEPAGELHRVIEGRPYFNLTLMGSLGARYGISLTRFVRMLGHGEELSGLPPPAPFSLLRVLVRPGATLRACRIQLAARRLLLRFFDRVHGKVRRLRMVDSVVAPDAELLRILREADEDALDFLYALQLALFRVSARMMLLEWVLPSGADADRFINATVAAGEKNVSVRQGLDLLLLSRVARGEGRVVQYLLEGKDGYREFGRELEGTRFLAAFREYLERYGHRGIHESDPAMPLYREDPGILLRAVGAIAADPRSPDPESTLRRQEESAASAWRALRESMGVLEKVVPFRILALRRVVRSLKEAMALREQMRFEGMRVNAENRRFLREVGRRFAERRLLDHPEDLSFACVEEIEMILGGKDDGCELGEKVRARKEEMERQRAISMPNLLRGSEVSRLSDHREVSRRGESLFRGLPVGPGSVEGTVAVLRGPSEMGRIRRGDILVAPTIDPSWIPLFTLAAGLVVEMGGTLSHGSIIAREYGLPTVVNIPGITTALKTGDRVFVDGSAGLVRRVGSD